MAQVLTIGTQTFSKAGEGGDIEVTDAEYLTLVGWANQQTLFETLQTSIDEIKALIARKA